MSPEREPHSSSHSRLTPCAYPQHRSAAAGDDGRGRLGRSRSFLAAVGVAFVLGAIVSPTDPLTAATIMRGRFDDATALVACRVVVAAAVVVGGTPRRSTIVAVTLLWPSSREARFGVESFSCGNKIRALEN